MIKEEQLKPFVKDRAKAMRAAAGWISMGKTAAALMPDRSHSPEQNHAGGGKLKPGLFPILPPR